MTEAEIRLRSRECEGRLIGSFGLQREMEYLCPHPKEKMVHEIASTSCGLCGRLFWGGATMLGGQKVTPRNFLEIREQLKKDHAKIESEMEEIQSRCVHPDSAREASPEEEWCGICLKDWRVVQLMRHEATR